LADGRVLVFGGVDDTEAGFLDDAWIWTPSTETWSEVASMSMPRADATGQLLTDGRVLVCGGWQVSGPASGCELFNPASLEWSPLPDPASQIVSRAGSVSAVLPDGEVIILGGYGIANNLLTDLLIYRP
jgi:N-acetylneuraminic acid mutarotase